MGTVAQSAIQDVIDAQQTIDAIEYGIRSIETCRGHHGASACHVAQIETALAEAGVSRGATYGLTLKALKAERAEWRELLKGAIAARRQIGNARQLRLALTGEAVMA